MKRIRLALFGLMAFGFWGCGFNEGIIQKQELGFLKFVGDSGDVVVQIDGDSRIPTGTAGAAEGRNSVDVGENVVYQLPPGKHTIKVYRDGKLVVNRIVVLDNQVVTEVLVP